MDKAIIPRN